MAIPGLAVRLEVDQLAGRADRKWMVRAGEIDLGEDLGVDPAPETRRVFEQLLRVDTDRANPGEPGSVT